MRLPSKVVNWPLAVLLRESGYSGLDQFANAVNRHGAQKYHLTLRYNYNSIKRWLRGASCEQKDVVAEVLSQALGIPISPAVIWPDGRDGEPLAPAHLRPWIARRTVADLGFFVRSDMLSRREVLADSISLASGPALVDPLARWLAAEPIRLPPVDEAGPGRIGLAAVKEIEIATARFMEIATDVGGGHTREAAVGQLRYAVDLLDHGNYSPTVGNRLLAAVAKLAGEVGNMSHDAGMDGPAQRYFIYGLQAAHESTDERARLIAVAVLAGMAWQMLPRHPDTGLQLVETAFARLVEEPDEHGSVRAVLWSLKGRLLAATGSRPSEVNSCIDLALDLFAESAGEDNPAWRTFILDVREAELYRYAASAYLDLAMTRPQLTKELATKAESAYQEAIARWGNGYRRDQACNHTELAQARFLLGEPDQACLAAEQALAVAAEATGSFRLIAHLRDLWAASEPYHDLPRVRQLREHLQTAIMTP